MVYFTYILVFVALALMVFLLQSTLSRLLLENLKKGEDVESVELAKLVKPERLLQLRMLVGSILITLALVGLTLGGVYAYYILIPVCVVVGGDRLLVSEALL